MGDLIVPAIALMLVLEGILPLTAPKFWRDVFRQMVELRDGQIRFVGLISIGIGLVLLYFVL
jgi:hypothetical protein